MTASFLSSAAREAGAPLRTSSVRGANLARVLRCMHVDGPLSRVELAAHTGLSKASVTSLMADLQSRGLVSVGEATRRGTVGRPSTKVSVAPSRVAGVGAEITPDSLRLVVRDLAGGGVWDSTLTTRSSIAPDGVVDALADLLLEALRATQDAGSWVAGVTLAPSGLVDPDQGMVRFSSSLGWRDVPVVSMLRSALQRRSPGSADLPIHLEHDAKLAALSESPRMTRASTDSYVFLTGDHGIAAGIIADGQLVQGWTGLAGEIGHIPVGSPDVRCRCGRYGCWETLVGLDVLLREVPKDTPLRDRSLSVRERLRCARELLTQQDPALRAAVDRIGVDLVRGASVLVDLLNPQALILGGYFGELGEFFAGPLQEALDARRLDVNGDVEVLTAEHGLDAACVGGAVKVLNRVLDDPTLVPVLTSPLRGAPSHAPPVPEEKPC